LFQEVITLATNFGSLGDLFPDQHIRCRVRGCPNLWQLSGDEAMHQLANGGKVRPDRMCDQCYDRFLTLQDQNLPCNSRGCSNTWVWNRFQQLEAFANGREHPPRGLCQSCRAQVNTLSDQELPCRMKGCSNTWTWSRQAQVQQQGKTPHPRQCQSCAEKLQQLSDRKIECRMRGCTQTWEWNRYQQLEHLLSGKDLESPSAKMCADCFALFQQFQEIELPCSNAECSRTWRYTIFGQIEHQLRLAQGSSTEAQPQRMCQACDRFFRSSVDRQIRCLNRGCSHSWTYTRAMQLHDWLLDNQQVPEQMCAACVAQLAANCDREINCEIDACDQTWTYTALDQLKDSCSGRSEPRQRRCRSCEQFLASHDSQSIACDSCGAAICWSAYEQLLHSKGAFVRPHICADCARKLLQREQKIIIPPREHHHIVRMPAGGKWGSDPVIADWPPHLDHHAIARAEKADQRIVVFGDDLSLSSTNVEESWPYLLEASLNQHQQRFGQFAVINVGIAECTSAQALVRLPRDVVPFAPHVVIFSFAFADTLLRRHQHRHDDWREPLDMESTMQPLAQLCRQLRKLPTQPLYWLANPVLPHDPTEPDSERWANAQLHRYNQYLVAAQHHCQQHEIPVLDLKARFEINGEKTARKWMCNWYNHNTTGARNIAIWMSEYLLHSGMFEEQ